MTEKQMASIGKLGAIAIGTIAWLSFLIWSAWMEWHGQHEHAVWVLLLVIAHSLAWLKSIEINTDRIPKR